MARSRTVGEARVADIPAGVVEREQERPGQATEDPFGRGQAIVCRQDQERQADGSQCIKIRVRVEARLMNA